MKIEESFNLKPETESTGLKISTQNYEKAAETLAIIAKEISGLSIPERTIQNWKTLLASMRIVDDRLDHIAEIEEREKFKRQIVNSLKGEAIDFSSDKNLEKAMSDIGNLSAGLEENKKHSFLNSLLRILQVTEKIKIDDNPKNLVNLTRLEGQITARIFLPFLPEEFRRSVNYQRLLHALTRLGRAANSFDSFIDLPTDHSNKQIKISPNIFNRILFLGAVLSDGLLILKDIGLSKNLIREFLLCARDTAQNYSERDLE